MRLPYRRHAVTASIPPRGRRGCLIPFVLGISVFLNVFLCGLMFWPEPAEGPREKHLYGPPRASDAVAVVRAEGPLVEGFDGHIIRQIEKAGRDPSVKAVVLRIDSPGGTIGSSEAIHRELTRLRTGKHPRFPEMKAKPLVASMGSIAASG